MANVLALIRTFQAIEGVTEVGGALVKYGLQLRKVARLVDSKATDKLLQEMRSRVPQDTGRLLNGITARTEDDVTIVEASAVRTSSTGKKSADYARFVEFGTDENHAGAGLFEADAFTSGARRRTSRRRRHAATPAEPFFFDSARDVLGKRSEEMIQAGEDAAHGEGFE